VNLPKCFEATSWTNYFLECVLYFDSIFVSLLAEMLNVVLIFLYKY